MPSFKINKNLIFQKLGKEITLFDSDKSQLITLNETASFVLAKLKKRLDNNLIAVALTEKYSVSKSKALGDTNRIIKLLIKKQIIYPD